MIRINTKNKKDLKKIYIHDFVITDFNYNSGMEKLSINLLSSRKELKNIELIFNNLIFLQFQDCDFWLSSYYKCTDSINIDGNFTYYKKLLKEFKSTGNKEDNYYPDKFNKENMEIIITTLTGGEIRIICREIMINEI